MLCKSVLFPEHCSEGMPDQQHGAAPVVHQVLEPEPKKKERYCTTSSNTACMSACLHVTMSACRNAGAVMAVMGEKMS